MSLKQWQGFVDGSVRMVDMIRELIPMQFQAVEPGLIKITACADKRHLLPHKIAHGGYAATILDTITAGAVSSALDDDHFASTTDLNVKMVKGIPPGKPLIGEARLVSKTRQLATAEGRLFDEEGTLYAWASCTCMILKRREPYPVSDAHPHAPHTPPAN